MSCPDENLLAGFVQGRLTEDEVRRLDEHVDSCASCRGLLGALMQSRPPEGYAAAHTEARAAGARASGVEVGDVIADKYRIQGLLGSGGMGVVFAAAHLLLDRTVAFKLMHLDPRLQTSSVERFQREARVAARLKSEHVARVLDLGSLPNGAPYLVMEYLEGEDLERCVARRGALEVGEAVRYVLEACEAVGEAHELGVVHRDIKPSNLFLTRRVDGQPSIKVLDFGLSKLTAGESDVALTETHTVLGSPLFMAPEQLTTPRAVDARADVWALGATLQFLLTGKPPFVAASLAELSAQVLRDEPRARPDTLPVELDAVLADCLAKDPKQRIASVPELVERLLPFAAPARDDAAPSLRAVTRARPKRGGAPPRARAWLVLGATLVAALLVVLAVTARAPAQRSSVDPPIVLLMDTPAAHGVYDPATLAHGATNADDLNDLLGDLPLTLYKEPISGTWNRESYALKLRPALVVIHRSAFFHGLNQEFDFGYPPFSDPALDARWRLLYRTADDKLVAFLGMLGVADPKARFIVYSRGTGDALWPTAEGRRHWVDQLERRFPPLRGRVSTFLVEGGIGTATFKNQSVAAKMREEVRSVLRLERAPGPR